MTHKTVYAQEEVAELATAEQLIEDYRQGRMVILVDDEDRENEGDLLIAAEAVAAEHINFMAAQGRGLICLTLAEERCSQLGLKLMVADNNARFSTAFTVSIEAAHGVTTGISAADRATTVKAAVRTDAKPEDIVTPGHIFPVMAQPGGVLTRAGHTEAGVDLARMAGFEASSVICEILKPDGSMARLEDLRKFAVRHGLLIGTIAELIRYRIKHEPTLIRVLETQMMTRYGAFQAVGYRDQIDHSTHLALVRGQIDRDQQIPVRVHVHRGVYHMLTDRREVFWSLEEALAYISQQPTGVLVILNYEETPDQLLTSIQQVEPELQASGNKAPGDLRMLGAGGQILADLGVGKMLILGGSRKPHALSGFDLVIEDYLGVPG